MTEPSQSRGAARRWLSILCRTGEQIAIGLLLVMTSLMVIQIVGREILNQGFPWADELARFCNIGLVFLAAPLLLSRGAHVRVDIFEKMLQGAARRYLVIATEALGAGFCAMFLYGAWLFMQRASRFSSPALAIPNILYYAPAILGVVLLFLVALSRTLDAVTDRAGEGSGQKS